MSKPLIRPWLIWGLGAMFYCYGFFQRVAPSVMVSELMRDFAAGAAITGVLSAFYFYTYASLQIPVGLLADSLGPRKLLAGAALFCGAGAAFFSFAPDLTTAYLGRALIGAGASVTWVCTLKLASVWFPPNRFALLTGLTMAFGMVGAVGGQVPLAFMVNNFGWRDTMLFSAFLAIGLSSLTYIIVRDAPSGKGGNGAVSPKALVLGLKAVLKIPQTYWIALYGSMTGAPMLAFAGLWGVPYLVQIQGMTRSDAAMATSTVLIGWGFGSPFMGWVSDHIGKRKLPAWIAAISLFSIFCTWIYWPGGVSKGVLFPLLFLSGLGSGGLSVCFALIREHTPPEASGAAMGVVNMVVMAGGAIFQPLIGWLLDLNWGGEMVGGARLYSAEAYKIAFITLPLCHLTSMLALLMIKETNCEHV